MEWWNIGMLILKGNFPFIDFPVNKDFCRYINDPFSQDPLFHNSLLLQYPVGSCHIKGLSNVLAADPRRFAARNLVLISNNEKEFKRVKNLKVENWVK